jgi:GNAT superfamily N-acetyltransferase
MIEAATRWLSERGAPVGWPVPFPSHRFEPAARAGDLYLVELSDGALAGTVTVQWEDPQFWGTRPPDSGYVHRFVVRREFAGRGVGDGVLAWAEGQVRARGRQYLRLDCLAASDALRRYYVAHGFRRLGERTVGGLRCALFEKPVLPVEPAGARRLRRGSLRTRRSPRSGGFPDGGGR